MGCQLATGFVRADPIRHTFTHCHGLAELRLHFSIYFSMAAKAEINSECSYSRSCTNPRARGKTGRALALCDLHHENSRRNQEHYHLRQKKAALQKVIWGFNFRQQAIRPTPLPSMHVTQFRALHAPATFPSFDWTFIRQHRQLLLTIHDMYPKNIRAPAHPSNVL